GGGRIVSVIGGQDEQIVLSKCIEPVRNGGVGLAQRSMKASRIVPVAVRLVEIYQVGEQEPTRSLAEPSADLADALCIPVGVNRTDTAIGEEIGHLAHAVARHACLLEYVQERLRRRREAEVAAIAGANVRPRNTAERTSDDPCDVVRRHKEDPGGLTGGIQLLKRD